MSGASKESTPYAVGCPLHGKVFLTQEEYDRQMGNADNRWVCPHSMCGLISWWDDDNYERAMGWLDDEGNPLEA